jgi:hypothetical protein
MDRKAFLKAVCGLGVCGCIARVMAPPVAIAEGQPEPAESEGAGVATGLAAGDGASGAGQTTDQRLAFARHQFATLVGFMAAGPAVPACVEILEKTGRACAKITGLGVKFKGDPEGYFTTARNAWGTEFHWDKAKGVVTVAIAEGPCGCPLVDGTRTPAFWCNCSVGYQQESFSALFGRPVHVTLKESKLSGAKRCVFEVQAGPPA